MKKTRTVSLINMKGGVGKSTLAVNLAWHFSVKENKRVLVVDLDFQFNASQYMLGQRKYREILIQNKPTIWDVFEQATKVPGKESRSFEPRDAIVEKVKDWISGAQPHLIPSRLELAFSLRNPGQKERLLAKSLEEIKDYYDLILIDCAPTESMLTMAAYLCSDFLLVPVKPEYLSAIGVSLLVNSMNEFKEHYGIQTLRLAGIVFNASTDYSPEEVTSKQEVRSIAQKQRWRVFEKEVPFSRSFPKGAREGKPLFWTSHARWEVKNQFEAFALELAERIGL